MLAEPAKDDISRRSRREERARSEGKRRMLDSAGLVKHARVRGDDRKLKHFEQSLLRHFLGVFAVAAHQPTIMKNLGAEVFHKAVKRSWFSGHQCPREFNFGFSVQSQVPLLIVAGSACFQDANKRKR